MDRCFRDYTIKRTCTKSYKDYRSYKEYLKHDFNSRCAYCNLMDSMVTSFFEIDHFVPQRIAIEHGFDFLITDYNNLVYACRNCNHEKSDQFDGDLAKNCYENKLFYNPVECDYNTIFYRNEYGTISSRDSLGNEMITRLKLYRTIHNLAWICERLALLEKKLVNAKEKEKNDRKKGIINEALLLAYKYHNECRDVFIANYNNKNFSVDLGK